jgi:hypothetical protein
MMVLYLKAYTLAVHKLNMVAVHYIALHFGEHCGVSDDCARFDAALEYWEDQSC